MTGTIINEEYTQLLVDVKQRVAASQYRAALSVNKELVLLYHNIGTAILRAQAKHGWGAKVIERLSKDLGTTDDEFVQEVLAQLTWYHNLTLLDKCSDKQVRIFYAKQAIEYRWSRSAISAMVMQIELGLHKRQGQAITNFKDKLPSAQADLAHYLLKDPYILSFKTSMLCCD